MITPRRSQDRGYADHGWLKAYHSFSFGDYRDPAQMGYRTLRVINEDRVQPGMGFGTHPHKNMEILTYVLEGTLEHKDSLGTGSTIQPGEIQRMSAGSGITHSEFNASKTEQLHLLQIWIFPEKLNQPPGYEQKTLSPHKTPGKWVLLASADRRQGSIQIHTNALVWGLVLKKGEETRLPLTAERYGWLQMVSGEGLLSDLHLYAGDGTAIEKESATSLRAETDLHLLFFDLA
jgi:quercetin 2,3-dioxygenase